ncbi:MAG: hypothetical protein EOL97_10015 [Spirochaetia bacterium]|nr:hypothetical protein [Spirochaetia bacterium]
MSEYKNPILEAMIDIKKGKFDKRYNQYLYPIVRWNSGNDKFGKMMNFQTSFYINQYLFVVPQKMTMSYMYFSYKMHKNFKTGQECLYLKYPKKDVKEKTEKYDVIVKYLKHIYNWSNVECKKNSDLINYYAENKDFITWLDNYVGFEKKEKKLFKIKLDLKTPNIEKEIESGKSLFDY